MTTSLTLVLRDTDQPVRLIAQGEIDIGTHDNFRAALAHATARHDRLVVDLTAVTFLGGAGVTALCDHRGRLTAVLVTINSVTSRALQLSELRTRLVYQPRRAGGGRHPSAAA